MAQQRRWLNSWKELVIDVKSWKYNHLKWLWLTTAAMFGMQSQKPSQMQRSPLIPTIFSWDKYNQTTKAYTWIVHGDIVSCTHNISMNDSNHCEKNCYEKICVLIFFARYLIVVVNGTKNPHRSTVAKDITDAILQTRASKGVSAIYHSKEEQESRLTTAFKKWSARPDVWSAAAPKVSASYHMNDSATNWNNRFLLNNCVM